MKCDVLQQIRGKLTPMTRTPHLHSKVEMQLEIQKEAEINAVIKYGEAEGRGMTTDIMVAAQQ